jgi:hypothetical protein
MMDGVGAANVVATPRHRRIAIIIDFMALNLICQNLARNNAVSIAVQMFLNFIERFTLGVRQQKRRVDEIHNLAVGENEKYLRVLCLPTLGRKIIEIAVERTEIQARMESGEEAK